MTEKLFYQNIHITEFDAVVTDCTYDEKSKKYRILLDRTAFFPEEGGQLADKGTLNGLPVIDVRIKNQVITHVLDVPLPLGETVHGQVDWEQRFDFCQQHSGEHIVSGLIHKHFGYDNVGFHLGLSEVTLDFNGELTWPQLHAIEAEANQMVWQNLPVHISYPDSRELAALDYRSKLDLTENVRIVEIPGADTCACCAPHVETTGQIGLIKITSLQRHRGGVRLNILCGGRALADYSARQASVSQISVLLSAKQEAVTEAVAHLKEENLRLKELGNRLQASLLSHMVNALPNPEKSRHALLFVDMMNEIALRNVLNELTPKYSGFCAAFAGNDETGYRFIIGSAALDCRELAAHLRQTFQAKGGGSAPMIQGTVQATKTALEAWLMEQ